MEQRHKTLLQRLGAISDLDEGRRDADGILSRAATAAREALSAARACAAFRRGIAVASEDAAWSETWSPEGALAAAVLEAKEPLAWCAGEEPAPTFEDWRGRDAFGAWMGAPMLGDAEESGVLTVMREKPFDADERELLSIIARHTATALSNLVTFQEVESLSVTDDLTRVYNYRFLKAALQREVERASRYGQVFSILMIDVDHLKKFNEVNGHLRGSELLRQLAAILSDRSRAIDLVAKYGGDEFLIILPQTTTGGAENMGWRICKAVEEACFSHAAPGQITISTGVSSFPHHGATVQSLLAAADQALFEAKAKGRNCVVAARGPASAARLIDPA
jgi:diguanylate cyclase (GGDEF)-like protein